MGKNKKPEFLDESKDEKIDEVKPVEELKDIDSVGFSEEVDLNDLVAEVPTMEQFVALADRVEKIEFIVASEPTVLDRLTILEAAMGAMPEVETNKTDKQKMLKDRYGG